MANSGDLPRTFLVLFARLKQIFDAIFGFGFTFDVFIFYLGEIRKSSVLELLLTSMAVNSAFLKSSSFHTAWPTWLVIDLSACAEGSSNIHWFGQAELQRKHVKDFEIASLTAKQKRLGTGRFGFGIFRQKQECCNPASILKKIHQ